MRQALAFQPLAELPISTHAPRVGCDARSGGGRSPTGAFQLTHPVWGATRVARKIRVMKEISTHAPRVGCDPSWLPRDSPSQPFQLTHPVWGATPSRSTLAVCRLHFNSRTPCGVRRDRGSATPSRAAFQLTHPVWGATHKTLDGCPDLPISTHAPRVGCDLDLPKFLNASGNFNSRTPCGVRPAWGKMESIYTMISTHAPRVGCDPTSPVKNAVLRIFQLTHPVWGATMCSCSAPFIGSISTHAPRVGCDLRPLALDRVKVDFNSRTPCGVRPQDVVSSRNSTT